MEYDVYHRSERQYTEKGGIYWRTYEGKKRIEAANIKAALKKFHVCGQNNLIAWIEQKQARITCCIPDKKDTVYSLVPEWVEK